MGGIAIMKGIIVVGAAALALSLGGCATVVEGTSQSVAIATQPPGASCTVSREGVQLSAVISTPGSVKVDKSRKDITVTCSKEGYQTTSVNYSSSFNGMTFGNIILGGAVGAVVDASTGANYNYPKDITMALPEAVAAAPVAAPTTAAATTVSTPAAAQLGAPAAKAAPAEKKPVVAEAPALKPATAPVPEGTRMSTPVAD